MELDEASASVLSDYIVLRGLTNAVKEIVPHPNMYKVPGNKKSQLKYTLLARAAVLLDMQMYGDAFMDIQNILQLSNGVTCSEIDNLLSLFPKYIYNKSLS